MGKLTGKGSRGPRKAVADAENSGQVQAGATDDLGNGDAGAGGTEAQANAGGAWKDLGFADFAILIGVKAHEGQIAAVWHPDARGDTHQLPNGSNARLSVGPAAYQMADGQHIVL